MRTDNTNQVGKGWAPLIRILDSECSKITGIKVYQVKEKFGGLRYYIGWEASNEKSHKEEQRVQHLIDCCETLSNYMCEACGAPGKHVAPKGWIKTLCLDCEKKFTEDPHWGI